MSNNKLTNIKRKKQITTLLLTKQTLTPKQQPNQQTQSKQHIEIKQTVKQKHHEQQNKTNPNVTQQVNSKNNQSMQT